VKTLRGTAPTGAEIQIWIEVRLCELGSDHSARMAGNGEYPGLGALVLRSAPNVRVSAVPLHVPCPWG